MRTFNFSSHTGRFEHRLDCGENGFLFFNVANGSMDLTVKDVENDNITMSDENGYTCFCTKVQRRKKETCVISEVIRPPKIRDNDGDVKSRYRYNTVIVKSLTVSQQTGSVHYHLYETI